MQLWALRFDTDCSLLDDDTVKRKQIKSILYLWGYGVDLFYYHYQNPHINKSNDIHYTAIKTFKKH